jgi:hypothetical protein
MVNLLGACRTIALTIIAIGQAACLAVPIPYPPDVGEVYIPQEKIDDIEIGKTSRRDIEQMFGTPDWIFGAQSRLIYKTRNLSTWQLGACAIGISGSFGCAERWYDTEILDITLDNHAVARQWEVVVPVLGECTASGVCLYMHDQMKVYATAAADLAAKKFDASSESCAVYLYSWKPARPDTTVRFKVDGNEDPYWHLEDTDFFRVDLALGQHSIGASVNWIKGVTPDSVALNCIAGESYFLRILIDGEEGASFGLIPVEQGRRAISDRNLLLAKDSPATAR